MMKGLMGHCLNHETTLDRLQAKATLTEDELSELKSWKVVQEKKLALLEEAIGKADRAVVESPDRQGEGNYKGQGPASSGKRGSDM